MYAKGYATGSPDPSQHRSDQGKDSLIEQSSNYSNRTFNRNIKSVNLSTPIDVSMHKMKCIVLLQGLIHLLQFIWKYTCASKNVQSHIIKISKFFPLIYTAELY